MYIFGFFMYFKEPTWYGYKVQLDSVKYFLYISVMEGTSIRFIWLSVKIIIIKIFEVFLFKVIAFEVIAIKVVVFEVVVFKVVVLKVVGFEVIALYLYNFK